MCEYKQIRHWIYSLPRKGKNTFSLSEVNEVFPNKPRNQIKNALNRLVISGEITSVWRGFYAIVLPEYGEKRIVPPIEYIDHLMKHLGKEYYVASLSAAALHGASHQKPLAFTFVCNQIIHPKVKESIRLVPLLKRHFPYKHIEQKNVNSGTINVSSPLLTAVDLILYPLKAGGFGNIATVLAELIESIEPEEFYSDMFNFAPVSVIQRLGYMLDVVLGEHTPADAILDRASAVPKKFRKTPLAYYKDTTPADYYNAKWKIVVNEEAEADI